MLIRQAGKPVVLKSDGDVASTVDAASRRILNHGLEACVTIRTKYMFIAGASAPVSKNILRV